jgi:hypothetical protein
MSRNVSQNRIVSIVRASFHKKGHLNGVEHSQRKNGTSFNNTSCCSIMEQQWTIRQWLHPCRWQQFTCLTFYARATSYNMPFAPLVSRLVTCLWYFCHSFSVLRHVIFYLSGWIQTLYTSEVVWLLLRSPFSNSTSRNHVHYHPVCMVVNLKCISSSSLLPLFTVGHYHGVNVTLTWTYFNNYLYLWDTNTVIVPLVCFCLSHYDTHYIVDLDILHQCLNNSDDEFLATPTQQKNWEGDWSKKKKVCLLLWR